MARGIHIELYEAFVAVSECGGSTAAAERLARTQATVSQQIKRLEETLGRPWFTRTSRSVRLTTAGETLLSYARQILRLHDEAASAVVGASHEPLRLGVPDLYADAVLPAFLDVLRREANSAPPVVHCDQSIELFERFIEGALDIILTARYPNFPAGRTVSIEQLIWVGRRGLRLAQTAPVPLIVYPEGCPFRARATSALRYAERRWQVVYTGQSGAALHAPLALGLGVTVMSRRTMTPDLEDVGPANGLPPMQTAALDLHLSTMLLERHGPALESGLLAAAQQALIGDVVS